MEFWKIKTEPRKTFLFSFPFNVCGQKIKKENEKFCWYLCLCLCIVKTETQKKRKRFHQCFCFLNGTFLCLCIFDFFFVQFLIGFSHKVWWVARQKKITKSFFVGFCIFIVYLPPLIDWMENNMLSKPYFN